MAQSLSIVAFLNDEHGERRDDVETSYEHDEGEKDISDEFLHVHDVEDVGLLLHAVEHLVAIAHNVAQLFLHRLQICVRF